MKIFRTPGALACIIMIISVFLPRVRIEPIRDIYPGMYTGRNNFYRKPGYINIFFASLFLVFIFIREVWTKRTNIFIITV